MTLETWVLGPVSLAPWPVSRRTGGRKTWNRNREPGLTRTWYVRPGTRNLGSGTWDFRRHSLGRGLKSPGTWALEPGTWDLGLGIGRWT